MLLSMLIALAQSTSLPPRTPDEIIVIGRQAEKEFAACLARNCPPEEEVEAALQASTEQFTDGRYTDARRTLQRTIRRNRQYAAKMPGPVSSLYATLSTVAQHDGDTQLWRSASRDNVAILREHAGKTHAATLREELSLADTLASTGMRQLADRTYETIFRRALDSGHRDLAAGATFRRAWLALSESETRRAESLADEALALVGSDNRDVRDFRQMIRAHAAVRRGDEGAIEALAAQLRQPPDKRPRLLFAPSVADINTASLVNSAPWPENDVRFADIGYWIRPDGRTADAEILRDVGLGQWAPVIVRQVRARRYVPLDMTAGQPGIYRIDRFTVRAALGFAIESRIKQRAGRLTVHVVDLTETDAMSTANRERLQNLAAKAAEP